MVLTLGLAGCQQCQKGQGIVAANPAPDEALALCRQSFVRSKEAGSLAIALTGCSDLFSRESCRYALRAVGEHPERSVWLHALETCRVAYCPALSKPAPGLCLPEKEMVQRVQQREVGELIRAVLTYELGRRATVLEMLSPPLPPDAGARVLFDAPMLVEVGLDGGALWMNVSSDEGTVSVDGVEELTMATRRWDPDGGVVVIICDKRVVFKDIKRVMSALNEGGASDLEFRSR